MQHGQGGNRPRAATKIQSIDLWEHAYIILKKRDPKLVSRFEDHLASSHPNFTTSTSSFLSPEVIQTIVESNLADHEVNRMIIRCGNEPIKVREKWDKIVHFLFWAKNSISAALGAQPYAALGWATLSILLPVSHGRNPK